MTTRIQYLKYFRNSNLRTLCLHLRQKWFGNAIFIFYCFRHFRNKRYLYKHIGFSNPSISLVEIAKNVKFFFHLMETQSHFKRTVFSVVFEIIFKTLWHVFLFQFLESLHIGFKGQAKLPPRGMNIYHDLIYMSSRLIWTDYK